MKRGLLVIVLMALSAVIAYTVIEKNPHDFTEGDCPKCHVDSSENPKVLTMSVTKLCQPCHKKINRKSSHPVDKVPESIRVPADLPLTDGKVTCNTCHNIHESNLTAMGGKTYFLRRPSAGREFCMACHEVKLRGSSHVEIVGIAHIGSRYAVTDRSQPLDPMSLDCIGCHDGSIGRAADYKVGQGVWSHNEGSHPVGINYQECRMKRGGLHAVSMISKKLRLFNGNIGCGTCHDMYSSKPGKLTVSNEGSKLCLSCHNK